MIAMTTSSSIRVNARQSPANGSSTGEALFPSGYMTLRSCLHSCKTRLGCLTARSILGQGMPAIPAHLNFVQGCVTCGHDNDLP